MISTSVAENGGRSCINASGVWTPAHGRDLAEALAQRLAPIVGRPLDHPQAQIAAFSNKAMARHTAAFVEGQLKVDGAVDLTAKIRGRGPLVERDGLTFLEPTVLWCDDPDHPLANTELLFPFVSVVQAPQEQMVERMGPTLVLTAITRDRPWIGQLLAAGHIERLNLGPICTNHLSWDQPHEGNLFEHLYRQRAFQALAV